MRRRRRWVFDLSDRQAHLDAKWHPLVAIDAVVSSEEFRPARERVRRRPDAGRKSRAGSKPMDAVPMFKTLLPSALCKLSDDQIDHPPRTYGAAYVEFLRQVA